MSELPQWRFREFPPLFDPNTLPTGPVLCFAPHPDDEIIGCGGMLAWHAARGDAVRVVHLTGGERGDPLSREAGALVEVRAEESRRALAVLGVEDCCALGLPDGQVRPDSATVVRIRAEIDRAAPVVVYAPSPFECHPDHLATSWAVAAAARETVFELRLLLYEINHPTLASWIVDVTPFADALRRSLEQFRSQLRYQDIVGKVLAAAYARTVNVDLPHVHYGEAYLDVNPERFPAVWEAAVALSRAVAPEAEA